MKTLNLPGMTCGGCARGVTAAITAVDPSAIVNTNVAARRVTVETTASEDQLREAVKNAGYISA